MLVAHADTDLLLRHTNIASLPQVQAALRGRGQDADAATIGRDPDGTKVLSAYQTIDSLGWHVFVEEPLSEAFAPLESAIWRTVILLVAFLLLASATGVLLVRRLVRPIESIQAAAAKIGSGALDQRIDTTSRDELGALAEEFNRMAEQLEESYANLEQKVDERTQELAAALERAGREEPRARDGEPPQVAVPGEHVARAADAAERDPRLLAAACAMRCSAT